jgi:hypothetical protein
MSPPHYGAMIHKQKVFRFIIIIIVLFYLMCIYVCVPMIGYVGYHEAVGEIYVAFQGSHGVENWWLDLDPAVIEPFKQFPKVVLHKGFYEGIRGVRLNDGANLLSNNTTCRLYCIEK